MAVLRPSVSAAQTSAQRIERRNQDASDSRNRRTLRKTFARAAKCAKRLPAARRRHLDRKVYSALDQDTIDSETIEGFLDALIATFGRWPETEPSRTVLRAVTRESPPATAKTASRVRLRRRFVEAAIFLRDDYAALPALDQREVESALTALSNTAGDNLDTAAVCTAIARALGYKPKAEVGMAVHDVITDYVADVAIAWTQRGLRPSRATRRWDSTYHSRFHRFADLVLTSVVEPWSKRHDGDQTERRASLRKAHARLPQDIRQSVRPTPRRSDVEWLVSGDHIRKALARI